MEIITIPEMKTKCHGAAQLMTPLLCRCAPALAAVLILTSCVDARTRLQGKLPVAVPADFAGMAHTGYSGEPEREYALLNELGVVWVHRDFSWSQIEPAKGKWNFSEFDAYVARANKEGKKVLGMLLYDVDWVHAGKKRTGRRVEADELPYFCEYARETIKRYNGRNGDGTVDAWCIWNEPNMSERFWQGTKAEFFALTRETAATVRELDRQEGTHTTLVGGVLNTLVLLHPGWVTGLFESGAMDQIDAVTFHPYAPKPEWSAWVYDWFRKKAGKYGFADKIWVNEIGYPTAPRKNYGTEVAEADMPDTVARTFVLLAAGGARKLFWYHLFDSKDRAPGNSEDWFGLVWRDGDDWRKKGGYYSYALCARHLPGKTLVATGFPGFTAPRGVETFYFAGPEGAPDGQHRVLIVWNNSATLNPQITLKIPGTNRQLWNLATGQPENLAGDTYAGTLYHRRQSKPSILFLTWDEP